MSYGTEVGAHLRAVLTQLDGKFSYKDWEEKRAAQYRHVWFTDFQSLHDYLKNPVPQGTEDKRLENDLEALRDCLWFDSDEIRKTIGLRISTTSRDGLIQVQ